MSRMISMTFINPTTGAVDAAATDILVDRIKDAKNYTISIPAIPPVPPQQQGTPAQSIPCTQVDFNDGTATGYVVESPAAIKAQS